MEVGKSRKILHRSKTGSMVILVDMFPSQMDVMIMGERVGVRSWKFMVLGFVLVG